MIETVFVKTRQLSWRCAGFVQQAPDPILVGEAAAQDHLFVYRLSLERNSLVPDLHPTVNLRTPPEIEWLGDEAVDDAVQEGWQVGILELALGLHYLLHPHAELAPRLFFRGAEGGGYPFRIGMEICGIIYPILVDNVELRGFVDQAIPCCYGSALFHGVPDAGFPASLRRVHAQPIGPSLP